MSGQKQSQDGKFAKGRIKPKRTSLRTSRARKYDGEDPQYQLVNPDPDVRYFWANMNSEGTGSQGYREGILGYEVILATDDPSEVHPRVCVNQKPGTPFIKSDMILMGIHREDAEILAEEGHDGLGGLVAVEQMHGLLQRGETPGAPGDAIDPRMVRVEGFESTELSRMQGRG